MVKNSDPKNLTDSQLRIIFEKIDKCDRRRRRDIVK